jgi:integrase/plasmid maintenance system antidote protein VapI
MSTVKATKPNYKLRTATCAELLALLDERIPTSRELWMFLNHFRERGWKRTVLAKRLGISYLYLNSLLYGSKDLTEKFCWRLRQAIGEPIVPVETKQAKARRRRQKERRLFLPKADRSFRLVPYEQLVASLDKGRFTAQDLWPIICYFKSHGEGRPALASRLGISYFHLTNMIYATKPITAAFVERLRTALSKPMPIPAAALPKQPPHRRVLPTPLSDGQPIPEGRGPTLEQHFVEYQLDRSLVPGSAAAIAQAIRRYSHWLGRPATLGDLTDQLVNRWLATLAAEKLSRELQKGLRTRILCLWRHAFRLELIPAAPLRVRTIRLDRRIPQAWTPEQLRSLIETVRAEPGRFRYSRVPRAAYWEAFIRVGYYTALRLGDLLNLRRDQIGPDGRFTVVQSKTGDGIVCQIRPDGMAAIDATFPPHRQLIFGGVISRYYHQQQFLRLLRSIGLRGSSKWLRRTGATALENVSPGASTAFLGHRSPDMAAKHYLDRVQLQENKPCPPPIDTAGLPAVREGGAA